MQLYSGLNRLRINTTVQLYSGLNRLWTAYCVLGFLSDAAAVYVHDAVRMAMLETTQQHAEVRLCLCFGERTCKTKGEGYG